MQIAWGNFTRQQHLHSRLSTCIQSEVETLLGADSTHSQHEVSFGHTTLQPVDIHSVANWRQQVFTRRTGLVLRFRNAGQVEVVSLHPEHAGGIPVWRKVQ